MEAYQIFFWVGMAVIFFSGFFLGRTKKRQAQERAQQEQRNRIDELMGRRAPQ